MGSSAMTEQAAVVLLNSTYSPLYVSTEAARLLLYPAKVEDMSLAATAIAGKVQEMIATGSRKEGDYRYGFLESAGRAYMWNVTRCDEWTATDTPWNYVLMIRAAELPQDKIKTITRQFNLAPRQEQVLAYLFQGLTSKEIANFMDLSPHTVKIHIRALMNKLQVTTRTALVGRVLSANSSTSSGTTS